MSFMTRVGERFQAFRARVDTFRANVAERFHKTSETAKTSTPGAEAAAARNADGMMAPVKIAAASTAAVATVPVAQAAASKLWTPGSDQRPGNPADLYVATSSNLPADVKAKLPAGGRGLELPRDKSFGAVASAPKAEAAAETAPAAPVVTDVVAPKSSGPKSVLEYNLTQDAIRNLLSPGAKLGLGIRDNENFDILDASMSGFNAKGEEIQLKPAISGFAPKQGGGGIPVGPNGRDLSGLGLWPTPVEAGGVFKGDVLNVKLGINRGGRYDVVPVGLDLRGFTQTVRSNQL